MESKMYQEEISLELEFYIIQQIYKNLLSAKNNVDVDHIFDNYLKESVYIWEKPPYIFNQYDRKFIGLPY
jgi:hypothetical protein